MSNETDPLEQVYGAKDSQAARNAYDTWAATYDAENLANGYAVPHLGAAFFARHVPQTDGPILDAGCGTGLVGLLLKAIGYSNLVGTDLSPGMLDIASDRGAYDRLYTHELGASPLPETDNSFAACTCFGSLGPGHAPAETLDDLIRITRPGGHVVFNVRYDTYIDQGLAAHIEALSEKGLWSLVDQSNVAPAFFFTEPEVPVKILIFKVR